MRGLLSICTTGGGSSILDYRDQALKAGLELHPWECGKSWVVVGVSNWGMRTLFCLRGAKKASGAPACQRNAPTLIPALPEYESC